MYKKEVLRPSKVARVGIWVMPSLERAWNHIHFSRIPDQLKDTEFWLHFGNILGTTKNSSGPRHDKTNKVTVCPVKTQISLGILSLCWAHTHFVGFVVSQLISLSTVYCKNAKNLDAWKIAVIVIMLEQYDFTTE